MPAHPRSRGENDDDVREERHAVGSSPLTRGKPCHAGLPQYRSGLIPAHAGKTTRVRRFARSIRAHPRSRGENPKPVAPPEPGWGSSPLTRGKHAVLVGHVEARGLIPAHAGKTRSCPQAWRWSGAHPRSRGENANFLGAVVSSPGSSPLTRGKLCGPDVEHLAHGLIPAHAGKTRR